MFGAKAEMSAPPPKMTPAPSSVATPSSAVGDGAGAGGTEDRADQHDADRELLQPRVERELLRNEEYRTGDDAGVVAEEQAAERSDRRDQ